MTAINRGVGDTPTQICISSSGTCDYGTSGGDVIGVGAGSAGGETTPGGFNILPMGGGILPLPWSNPGLPSSITNVAWMALALFGVVIFGAYKVTEGR